MRAQAAPLDRSEHCAKRLRHEARSAVAFSCELRVGNGPWRPASMVDLSCRGFRLTWLPDCAVGKPLWVRIPGLEARQATIRWRDNRGVGCQFDRPLHDAVIDFLSRATIRPGR